MSLLAREAKPGPAGREGALAWPPPRPFWITRDSSLNGAIEDVVDVWTATPERCGHVDFPRSHYWMSGEWDLSTRWGRYAATVVLALVGVVPDDDRQVVRVD